MSVAGIRGGGSLGGWEGTGAGSIVVYALWGLWSRGNVSGF